MNTRSRRWLHVLLIVCALGFASACGGGAESVTPPPPAGPSPLRIDTATLANATVSAPYTAILAASGGTSPYSWTLTAGNLPTGLTVSNAGTISGNAGATGSFVFTLQVKDNANQTATRQFSLTVNAPTMTFDAPTLPNGTIGVAYNAAISASGGTAPINFSVSAGSLPAGITLSNSGAIAGTPTATGTSTFTVTGSDSAGQTISRQYSIVINATTLSITTQSLPSGQVGVAYSQTLAATGGTAPYNWSLAAGSLPTGLSLSAAGVISGTPTAASTPAITVQLNDASGQTVTRQYVLTVTAAQLVITSLSLTGGDQTVVGATLSGTLAVSGGTGPYTFAVTAGSLPSGVTLNANGSFSGSPTTPGTFAFTVEVTDATGQKVSRQYQLIVQPPVLQITTSVIPAATVNVAYSTTLAATGGVTPYNWSVSAGTLPAGVTLSTAGVLSGTPTAIGAFNFTAQVSDGSSQTATRQFSLTVGAPQLSITTAALPAGTLTVAYSQSIATSGGLAPFSFTVSSGSLPAGLSLSGAGAITGTPTALGTANFTVNVTDASAQSVSQQFSITVNATTLSVATQTLSNATVNIAYNATLTPNGGVAPYTWSVASGSLPAGVTLATNGTLSGTPTVVGSFNFTAQVNDGSAQTATRQFTLTVVATQLSITTSALPQGTLTVAYSQSIATAGGLAPYNFTVSSGTLPAGLSLSTAGTISGTPTALGTANFTVNVTDASAQSVSQQFSITVNATTLGIATQSVPSATVNVAYSTTLTPTGGVAPYSWSLSAGALPAGVSLAADGTLSGTPTAVGSFSFTAQVSDGSAQTANRQFTLTVGATQLSITTSALPDGTLTVAYSQSIATSGGLAPYNFTVSSGSLPAGLAMSGAGAITGTPTALGTSNFTVNVTDASSQSVSQQLSITINATTLSVATQTIPNATAGSAYSTTITPTGGVAPYAWSVASGTLPTGITLAANGTLSGTTNDVGAFNFTAQVDDGSSQTATRQFTLTVNASQLSITTTTLPQGTLTVAYSQSIGTSGGLAPYNFSISAGSLPAGLAMSGAGAITGTPTALGTSNFTVNVTDASSQSVSQQFSITVNATTLGISTQSIPSATVNVAYNTVLAPTGGVAPYSWTVSSGSIPAGVSLAADGTLSGTPTVVGAFNFTAQVDDGSAQTATRQFTLTVSATQLSITTTTLPQGTLTVAYSQSITTSGGLAPYNFTISTGALPAGLSMSTAGAITGTPTTLGTANFTVNVTDASSQSVSQQFSITVNATTLSVATQTVPNATAGSAFNTTITPTGGVAPYAWSVASGTLPTGITLAANGTLSGTTNDVGAFNFTAQVDDGSAQTASRQFTLTVNASPLDFVTTTLPAGVQGTAYSATITLSGGLAPYVFSTSGTLPTGVTLSAGGAFSGTPTAIGTFNFTVIVDDASNQHIERQFQIVINATSLTLNTLSVPDGVVNTAYSTTLAASGGVPAYTWSITGGALPTGLSLNTGTGEISGTPTVSGSFSFTAQVTDNSAQSQSRGFTIVINPSTLVIDTLTLPDGTLSVAYSSTITASGGTPAFTFAVDSGTVPTGLTLSTGGVLSGTPTAIGQFSFVVRVDDSAAQSATRNFTVNINPSALQITTQTLPDTVVGNSYSQTLASTGGVSPFTWDVTSGSVPTGLTLSTGGLLSGTPSTAGTFTFTARVSDGSSQQASRQFTIVVAPPPLSLDTLSLPAGTVNVAYNTTLTASGGTPAYTWAVTAGTLPTGLTLSSGGVLSGTTTANGSSTITIRVTDSAGTPQQASRQFTLTINPAPLQITTQTVADGVQGVAYSQTLVSSGGVAPFTWTVTAGALPTGLSLSTAGAITGSPSTTGSFTFTARVADTSSQQASRQFTIVVAAPPLSLDTLALAAGTVSSAYNVTLAASGGTPPYTWSSFGGSLPAGLTLSAGGVLSGTPTTHGTSVFSIRVRDNDSPQQSASRQFSLTINPQPLQITTQTVADGVVGVAYSQTLASSGGVAPFTWTVTSGALPTGLSLSTTGAITGSPSAAGSFTFTARVADSSSQLASRQYTIVIAPPPLSLDTLSLPAGTVGTAYTTTLVASGGTPAYTWALTAGTLPAGLTLSTGGVLSGTPTANGASTITIRVTDSAGTPQQASRQFSLTINPPPLQITTQTVPDGVVGIAYSQTLVSSGGVAPFTWTVTAGSLPTGLSLSTAGAITGTPSAAGSFTFTARVQDGAAQQASRQYTIVIAPPPLSLDTLSLPAGTVGTAYSTTLTASGGTPAYTWAVTAGTLPAGLTLSTGGVLSGTPTANGASTITIRVTDSAGTPQQASRQFTLTINPQALQITTQTVPDGVVGVAYSQTLVSTGGVAPFTWTVTAGALPTGLSLSTAGAITGTPSAAGSFTFTARVADGSSQQASRQYTIVIAPPPLSLDTVSLPNGTVGTAYNTTLTASGGTPAYTWAVTAGTLPAGLTLSTGGVLSGTPTTNGAATITIRVTDSAGTPQQASRQFTLTINPQALQITTQTVPDSVVGTAYSTTLASSGGVAPFTWTVTAGALPTGLSLSTAGAITGTSSAAGSFTFTARVADGSSQQASRQFTIVIAPPPLSLVTLSLPNGTVGTAYSTTLTASGGTPAYTWAVTAGTLPAGLTLSSAGVLSGTPTANGAANITIRVTDSAGTPQQASRQFTLTVNPPALQIATQSVPDTVVGASYSQTLSATGGVTPYTWTITGGSLPTGLTLSTAGVISGTPSANGTFVYTVQVADASAQIASRQFTTVVAPTSLSLTTVALPNATVNQDYAAALEASGGVQPYTWTLTAGTLPAGLSLSSAGTISGTATSTGTSNITIQVQDSGSQTAQRQFSLTVVPQPLQILTNTLPDGPAGTPYNFTMTGAGGTTPYSWSIVSGLLPPGVNFSSGGVFSGTPGATGQFPVRIRLSDSTGQAVFRDMTVNVTPVFRITTAKVWGGILNTEYNQTLQTADANGAVTWSVSAGSLPTGLTLGTATGLVSGTPTATGIFNFTIRATDASANAVTRNYLTIISPSDSNYGNVGDPYATEGGAPDPAATVLTACTGNTALLANRSYRLGQNVNAATPSDRCFTLATGVKLDLAGFTVTGSIKLFGSPSGVAVFNGTINCSVLDSVTTPGCLSMSSGAIPTVTARIHHLTIRNTGTGTRGMHIDWAITSKPAILTARFYNLTIVVPTQLHVPRSYAISFQGVNQTPEFFNNDLTCSGDASACQGIMCYATGDCKVHHNKINLDRNASGGDTARGILFDGVGQDGEAWNNLIDVHNSRAIRVRGTFNVRIHDNKFLNVEDSAGSGAVHLADPASTDTNDLNALVDNNDFQLAGGNVIFMRNGINATVRNNRFTCNGLCSASTFILLRSPLSAGAKSILNVENNPDVILYMAPPQNQVDAGAILNICNSGQTAGLGTVNITACPPQ